MTTEILVPSPPDCTISTCAIKPASWCSGCPREKCTSENKFHYVPARIGEHHDIVVLAESPVVYKNMSDPHRMYADDGGKLVRSAFSSVQKEVPRYADLRVAYTYAVLCLGADPNKETADHCRTFLANSLELASSSTKQPVIVAMGLTALKSLGIAVKSQKEVQNRVIPNVEVGQRKYTVVCTISMKQLVAMPGMYTTFYNDVKRAFDISTVGVKPDVSMDALTSKYVITKTVAEGRDLCEHILGYSEGGKDPATWYISADTETNTLFPHRDTLKTLCVSFAWGTGLAGAIPLWHPETPYDPKELIEPLKRLMGSVKPKVFHNAKYDLKVFLKLGWPVKGYVWDTMLAEHALEEDKKGLYGLKELTRVFFPDFTQYADLLHEMLVKADGESQLENIRMQQKLEAERQAQALSASTKIPKKKSKGIESGGFEKIPLATLLPYAAIDTDMTRRLALLQNRRINEEEAAILARKRVVQTQPRKYNLPQLCKDPSPTRNEIISKTAIPVSAVLAGVEFRGIRVDRPFLSELQTTLSNVIVGSEAKLHMMAAKGFETDGTPRLKLNSAAAVANVLFSEGYIHPETGKRTTHIIEDKWRTPTGQAQTTEKVMKYLVARHKCFFAAEKLVYAKAFKAKNTFCKNVWDLSTLDGFLHTNYNIHGTGTGRLSSNDENMQNIPKKLAKVNIKKVFITDDDSYLFVNADAKGAEVRIFTAYAQDAGLIASLNSGEDTHSFVANKIITTVRTTSADPKAVLGAMNLLDAEGNDSYALTYDDFNNRDSIKLTNEKYGDILSKFRDAVKRVVFGILYGAGPKKIAETAGISDEQAQSIIDMLFALFPSIPTYMDQTRWELRTFGYVETYFGRRRRFSVKEAANYMRGRAERQCVNFKIQSTSSDIVMRRLVHMDEPLRHDFGGRILLTVHDSIGFQMPKKYITQLPEFVDKHLLVKARTLYPWLPVDFKWDFEVGPSYGELKPLDAYLQNHPEILEAQNVLEEAYTEEEIRIELADPTTE